MYVHTYSVYGHTYTYVHTCICTYMCIYKVRSPKLVRQVSGKGFLGVLLYNNCYTMESSRQSFVRTSGVGRNKTISDIRFLQ